MARFNFDFSRLAGKAKAADEDEAKTDEDKAKAETETDEDKAAAEPADDEDKAEGDGKSKGDDEDEEGDDAKAAYRRGVRAERARCAAIFAAAEPAQAALAANLAFNTGVTAAEAVAVLKATPMKAGRLDAAMKGASPAPIAQKTENQTGRLVARMKAMLGQEN